MFELQGNLLSGVRNEQPDRNRHRLPDGERTGGNRRRQPETRIPARRRRAFVLRRHGEIVEDGPEKEGMMKLRRFLNKTCYN